MVVQRVVITDDKNVFKDYFCDNKALMENI